MVGTFVNIFYLKIIHCICLHALCKLMYLEMGNNRKNTIQNHWVVTKYLLKGEVLFGPDSFFLIICFVDIQRLVLNLTLRTLSSKQH